MEIIKGADRALISEYVELGKVPLVHVRLVSRRIRARFESEGVIELTEEDLPSKWLNDACLHVRGSEIPAEELSCIRSQVMHRILLTSIIEAYWIYMKANQDHNMQIFDRILQYYRDPYVAAYIEVAGMCKLDIGRFLQELQSQDYLKACLDYCDSYAKESERDDVEEDIISGVEQGLKITIGLIQFIIEHSLALDDFDIDKLKRSLTFENLGVLVQALASSPAYIANFFEYNSWRRTRIINYGQKKYKIPIFSDESLVLIDDGESYKIAPSSSSLDNLQNACSTAFIKFKCPVVSSKVSENESALRYFFDWVLEIANARILPTVLSGDYEIMETNYLAGP